MYRFLLFCVFAIVFSSGCAQNDPQKVAVKGVARAALIAPVVTVADLEELADWKGELTPLKTEQSVQNHSSCITVPNISLKTDLQKFPRIVVPTAAWGENPNFRVLSKQQNIVLAELRRPELSRGYPELVLDEKFAGGALVEAAQELIVELFGQNDGKDVYRGCLNVSTVPVVAPIEVSASASSPDSYAWQASGAYDASIHLTIPRTGLLELNNPNVVAVDVELQASAVHLQRAERLGVVYRLDEGINSADQLRNCLAYGGVIRRFQIPARSKLYVNFYGGYFPDSSSADTLLLANRFMKIDWKIETLLQSGSKVSQGVLRFD